MAFHEVQFPPKIALGARGGPERRTDVVVLGSGYEERNQRWAHSRRRFQAGYGIKSLDDLHELIAFFEERRGMAHGFRWKDWADYKSCPPQQTPADDDQIIGTGDGVEDTFQLVKTYGSSHLPYEREIRKPVAGTVLVAVNGVVRTLNTHYTLDTTTGVITFTMGNIPAIGHVVTAGYEFDVPARFDTDRLELDLKSHRYGDVPDVPIIEIRV